MIFLFSFPQPCEMRPTNYVHVCIIYVADVIQLNKYEIDEPQCGQKLPSQAKFRDREKSLRSLLQLTKPLAT